MQIRVLEGFISRVFSISVPSHCSLLSLFFDHSESSSPFSPVDIGFKAEPRKSFCSCGVIVFCSIFSLLLYCMRS